MVEPTEQDGINQQQKRARQQGDNTKERTKQRGEAVEKRKKNQKKKNYITDYSHDIRRISDRTF